jgi:predicted tellurium resistance membrane protein TerC
MLYFLNYKLLCLIALEVILGIDNIIFITIISDRLPEDQRKRLRFWGISIACALRLAFLGLISWIIKLDKPLFTVQGIDCTWKGLILIVGGIFLIYKSIMELHHNAQPANDAPDSLEEHQSKFNNLLLEVILIDIVFSIESIITSVGMVTEKWMMYTAVIVSVIIMLASYEFIGEFIHQNPSFKILGLCFLMMIGVVLLVEGMGFAIPSGYVYFSMGFAFFVTVIQMKTMTQCALGGRMIHL